MRELVDRGVGRTIGKLASGINLDERIHHGATENTEEREALLRVLHASVAN
jgi:hypothetical protein